jgi:predicted O-methyltransferase YrrM
MVDAASIACTRRTTPAWRMHYDVPEGILAIQVGPREGKLLGLLLRLVRATKVVEVGTLVGYWAIHMAR